LTFLLLPASIQLLAFLLLVTSLLLLASLKLQEPLLLLPFLLLLMTNAILLPTFLSLLWSNCFYWRPCRGFFAVA
jgi:hypothetical protein